MSKPVPKEGMHLYHIMYFYCKVAMLYLKVYVYEMFIF